MADIWAAFAVSFGVVFVAELGDKSQLMAMTFATRYKAWQVLVGITGAAMVLFMISVWVGRGLDAVVPTGWIALVAALAFFGFALWTFRNDEDGDEETERVQKAGGKAIVAVGATFAVAELGDKTMLAVLTLATQYGWFGTWIGSTLGMVAADALAIIVGRYLGHRLPERAIRIGAAVLFIAFGVWLLIEAITELT